MSVSLSAKWKLTGPRWGLAKAKWGDSRTTLLSMSRGGKCVMPDDCDQQMLLKVKDCHWVALRSHGGPRWQGALDARISRPFSLSKYRRVWWQSTGLTGESGDQFGAMNKSLNSSGKLRGHFIKGILFRKIRAENRNRFDFYGSRGLWKGEKSGSDFEMRIVTEEPIPTLEEKMCVFQTF